MPRVARDLGVFVRVDEAMPVLRALLDAWRDDLRYRISRVKARLKFMVDDYGPEGIRARSRSASVTRCPTTRLEPLEVEPSSHLGVEPQQTEGLVSVGVPVHLGLALRHPDGRARRARRGAR